MSINEKSIAATIAFVVVAGLMAGGTVNADHHRAQDKSDAEAAAQEQGQQQTKRGQILTLSSYLGMASQDWNQESSRSWERQEGIGETDAEEEDRTSAGQESRYQSESERERAESDLGEARESAEQSFSRRYGQTQSSNVKEQLVLVAKEGGLFSSGERAYLLVFASGASMTQQLAEKAHRLAQGGTMSRIQGEDPSSQESARQPVRGSQESGQENEVEVTGSITEKGGLRAIKVSKIESSSDVSPSFDEEPSGIDEE